MSMEVKDGTIILTPKECVCMECGTVIPPKTKYNLCQECVKKIKEDTSVG